MAVFCIQAFAALKGEDLEKQVVITEKASLLSQVDAVSLYMTSEKVAFAPRLLPDNIIEVEITVLNEALLASRASLESFVKRRIAAFNSLLKERLPVFAPSIAKSFNEKDDIKFVVNATSARRPVAVYSGGVWSWSPAFMLTVSQSEPEMLAEALQPIQGPQLVGTPPDDTGAEPSARKGKLGCNCPARKKKDGL